MTADEPLAEVQCARTDRCPIVVCGASTESLVNSVLLGDKSAYARLVERYRRAAIITARAVLRDTNRAEDAAQEAFIIGFTKLKELRRPAAFGPWLLRIAYHRAITIQRKQREQPLASEIRLEHAIQVNDWMDKYEEVVAQLSRLSDDARTIVILRYLNGHSVQEIADMLGKPVEAVKKQLSRALTRLRQWLKG